MQPSLAHAEILPRKQKKPNSVYFPLPWEYSTPFFFFFQGLEIVIKEFPGSPAELRKGNSYPMSFSGEGPEDVN